MTVSDNWKLKDELLRLSFLRVHPGKERGVVDALRQGASNQESTIYKCFGHYDLVCMETMPSVQLRDVKHTMEGIYEAVYLAGFYWDSPVVGRPFSESLAIYPLALLSLLKLNPSLGAANPLKYELAVLRYLAEKLGGKAVNLLTSLGHSEIILVIGGSEFQSLCEVLWEIRDRLPYDASFINSTGYVDGPPPDHRPLLIDTISFPLVSYPNVIDQKRFDLVQGLTTPILKIACEPGSESSLVDRLPDGLRAVGGAQVHGLLGRHDMALNWAEQIDFGQYLKCLLDFRELCKDDRRVCDTSSEFLTPLPALCGLQGPAGDQPPVDIPDFGQFLDAPWMDEPLRNSILDFLIRFSSCRADPVLSLEYMDFVWFLDYLATSVLAPLGESSRERDNDPVLVDTTHVEALSKTQSRALLGDAEAALEVANTALFQRYCGIEAHLEGVPYPPFTSTVGVNRIVAAASAIPAFAYDVALRPQAGEESVWPGFTCFMPIRGFEHHKGTVILYPERALFDPLGMWLTATHEISHGAYFVLQYRGVEPEEMSKKLAKLNPKDKPPVMVVENSYLWDELFAQWFDFRHFYTDWTIEEYLASVWTGWLGVPAVWEHRWEYLCRSLLLYVWSDVGGLQAERSRRKRRKHIEAKWRTMIHMLPDRVANFTEFLDGLPLDDKTLKDHVFRTAWYVHGLIVEFQDDYYNPNAADILGARYDDLERHVEGILRGEAVTSEVGNPVRLLFELVRRSRKNGIRPPLSATVATILVLASDYKRRVWQRLVS